MTQSAIIEDTNHVRNTIVMRIDNQAITAMQQGDQDVKSIFKNLIDEGYDYKTTTDFNTGDKTYTLSKVISVDEYGMVLKTATFAAFSHQTDLHLNIDRNNLFENVYHLEGSIPPLKDVNNTDPENDERVAIMRNLFSGRFALTTKIGSITKSNGERQSNTESTWDVSFDEPTPISATIKEFNFRNITITLAIIIALIWIVLERRSRKRTITGI